MSNLLKEIQTLNGLVLKRNEEINTWRTRYTQLELLLNEIRLKDTFLQDLEKKIKDLEFDNSNLRKKMNEGSENIFKFDESPFRNKIEEFSNMINELNREIKELRGDVSQKEKEIIIKNNELSHYKNENSKILYVQESGFQKDTSGFKENIRTLENSLQKEKNEKEGLWVKINRMEKICMEIALKDERILALESRNNLLIREIEDWKRRHESFQRSVEQDIERK